LAWFKKKSKAQKAEEKKAKEKIKEERQRWLAELRKAELQKRREAYKKERLKIATEKGRRMGQPFSQKVQSFFAGITPPPVKGKRKETSFFSMEPSGIMEPSGVVGGAFGSPVKQPPVKRKKRKSSRMRKSKKVKYIIRGGKAYPVG